MCITILTVAALFYGGNVHPLVYVVGIWALAFDLSFMIRNTEQK